MGDEPNDATILCDDRTAAVTGPRDRRVQKELLVLLTLHCRIHNLAPLHNKGKGHRALISADS
jgi:hypothetical protein